MKRKFISSIMALTMAAGIISGCGSASSTSDTPEQAAATEDSVSEAAEAESTEAESTEESDAEASEATEEAESAESDEEDSVGMANPWVDITEEEATANCPRLFKAPEGATDISWMMCEELGDPDTGKGPMIQLSFMLDGLSYTARAQAGAAEDEDIAGNFVEWTVGPEDVTLANWGEGNMTGKSYRSINDSGYLDMITWYDVEIGIAYSLTVGAEDLDGFDIQAVAEQMYAGENGDIADMADDFVQEQSGKTSFDSYDDVIAALTSGQGYAYIKLMGSDEEILAVTDLVFEADKSAYEVSIYGKLNGEVKQLGTVTGNGSSYPLRLADGVLYAGGNHSYETYFLAEDTGALMMKDYITDGVDAGSNEFSGFTRETNSFDSDSDFTGGQEEFDKLLSEREEKPVIEFTVVE